MPKSGWVMVPANPSRSYLDMLSPNALMTEYSTNLTPNVIVQYTQKNPSCDDSRYYHDSDEELENYQKECIEAEAMFDDYFHNPDEDGNLACNGISMKDDMEGCEAYQQRHPDICMTCTRSLRVRL